jgi:transaldolase
MAKEKMNFADLIKAICKIVVGPVSVECVAGQAQDIIEEARRLARLAPNIVVKIPITKDGLKATRLLSQEGIGVNTTLVFSPAQALLAAKAGSRFVSPFIGRLDDISQEGMDLVREILAIYENYDLRAEVIVASIRHPRHVIEAALLGAPIVTVPFAVMDKLLAHPLTDIGIDKFLKDWGKVAK